eukprot:353794-Chlamydomonas_euryale.AAC.12
MQEAAARGDGPAQDSNNAAAAGTSAGGGGGGGSGAAGHGFAAAGAAAAAECRGCDLRRGRACVPQAQQPVHRGRGCHRTSGMWQAADRTRLLARCLRRATRCVLKTRTAGSSPERRYTPASAFERADWHGAECG